MKFAWFTLAAVALSTTACGQGSRSGQAAPATGSSAAGATAPYNEAVRVVAGKRIVELPPANAVDARFGNTQDPPSKNPTAHYHDIFEVETLSGLMDCTTQSFQAHACEPTTFGTADKQRRYWVVKMRGRWFECVNHDRPVECIDLISTDGKLHDIGHPVVE